MKLLLVNRKQSRARPWQCQTIVLVLVLLALSHFSTSARADDNTEEKETTSTTGSKGPFKPMALQDAVKKTLHQDAQAAREKYWQKTLEEIRSLKSPKPKKTKTDRAVTVNNLNRWKLWSTTTTSRPSSLASSTDAAVSGTIGQETTTQQPEKATPQDQKSPDIILQEPERYNGYFSWERQLQEWADDIQEYMDKVGAEGKGQYPMSTFGIPKESDNLKGDGSKEANDNSATTQVADSASSAIDIGMVEKEEKADTIVPSAAAATEVVAEPTNSSPTKTTATSDKNNNLQNKVPRPVPASRKEGEAVLPHTDISDKSKRVWIVTTAALPWMTGTAVNPLLRAAYMTEGRKEAGGSVTLLLPWLERQEDQDMVYGQGKSFSTPEDQEAHIRGWLKNTAKMEDASEVLDIRWYTAWQNKAENSVYSMGDIVADISEDEVDIMVLEEPEHLNWYRAPGEAWTRKFKHVVGIVHTNYFVYAQDQPAAFLRAPGMKLLCTWMCRSHCHRLIKLSGTLPVYAPEKELIENVHGVRGRFVEIGRELRQTLLSPEAAAADPVFSPNAEPAVYFIGKMLWSKGIGPLMELLKYAEEAANIKPKNVDMYGGGPDKDAAEEKAKTMGLDMTFHGPIDHAALATSHKVFINPSTSEVLCTTVAEALAMGKFVVLPSHPSNDFFAQFPNCLTYTSKEEFVGVLYYALTHSPEPMSEEYSYALTWEAATERFEAAGCIPVEEAENYKRWVASGDAGIDISLPPLIESEEDRKLVATTLEKSRSNFRKFRDNLSREISVNKVLPKAVRESVVKELNRRLDLNIDELLNSPKLELKLSPAELDQQCLELFESVSKGPSGDVLRIIGGGNDVALQHRYMKRQAIKQLKAANAMNSTVPFFVGGSVESTDENSRTASQWVRWAMRRNLPTNGTMSVLPSQPQKPSGSSTAAKAPAQKETENNLQMSILQPSPSTCGYGSLSSSRGSSWTGMAVPPPSRLLSNARKLSANRGRKGLSLLI
ncbi:Digalactosyldiacylglycerol synthase 1, chloroplastic [Seminavis robusta]|uniref:Digalactosyldiacylglycerol synthase 1, chloroplastic n=1 Tax=Seminavis robusta TaxID=568900 RepID=A0A9N8EK34_9STRA|nr:Digalactosyldiacylglycerol synthase 1, chloroplastic [Seminavis robusta]|eukprot:Sro1204_g252210.1 Digalactosyldiacylglycerol synthase 1, chloroplastic (1001) ;mRNA; r:18116-21560